MPVNKFPPNLPKKVTILGVTYKVIYVDRPSDTDANKKMSLWGQIDYWDNVIRIYAGNERSMEAVWRVIFHEIIHGVTQEYYITEITQLPEEVQERVVETLAAGLYDTLTRSGILKFK